MSSHQCWTGGSQGGLSTGCHPGQDSGCPFTHLVACTPQELLTLCSSQSHGEAAPSSPQQGSSVNPIHLLFPEAWAKLSIKTVSREAGGNTGTRDRHNMRSRCLSLQSCGGNRESQSSGEKAVPTLRQGDQQSGQARGPPDCIHCPLTVPMGWMLVGWIRQYHSSLRWQMQSVLYCVLQQGQGRMEGDANVSDLGHKEEEEEEKGVSVSPSSASGSSGASPACAAAPHPSPE